MDIRKAALAAIGLLTTPACADPISGYVSENGTPLIASSLYTVSHPNKGRYIIQFTTPMEPKASCVISPAGTPRSLDPAFLKALSESDTACSFELGLSGLKSHIDSAFSFIATPMSD